MKIFNINFTAEKLSLKTLIDFAETKAVTENVFKEYLAVLLTEDDNVLSRLCAESAPVGDSLKSLLADDMRFLWGELLNNPISGYVPSLKRKFHFAEYGQSLESLVAAENPDEMLGALIAHYRAFGSGGNAKYIAFKWRGELNGGLQGISTPDDITLDGLFCLERQKEILINNTVSFLKGSPCNSVLLYGDSGSGKSSIVKALLNEYYADGLRLIEMPKSALGELPQLIRHSQIRDSKFKYIIFMDDLSFEQNDAEYKDLKVILEGQIEKQPPNVLVYATSNRRHLVSETWAERSGDDVHVSDTVNEKLSLSERFGVNIFFGSATQEEYFKMIEGILLQRNPQNSIAFSEQLKREAVKWELEHGGRSGRIAAQFVNSISRNTS